MGGRPVTVRMARWSAEHPWRAIALWVVFVAVCFVGGNAAGLNEATSADQAVGESGRADMIVTAGDFHRPAVENVLITPRSGALDQAAAQAAAADAADRLRQVTGVASVGVPVPSRDGAALLLPVTMSGDPETASDRVQPLRDATAEVQRAHPGLRIEQVGGASVSQALNDTLGRDFQRAELLSLPVTLAILVVAFGALIAAGVPVLLALSSVAAAMGLSTLASHLVPATDTTASVILLIGMAVGVDYSLFYVRREREERAKGRSGLDAVEIAAETSGHAVVVSGVAVMISMAGLLLAGDAIFSSLAVGSILVVAVAVTGSLSVLPALLAKLGRWVDRPRIPLLWRLTATRTGPDGRPVPPRFWPAVLRPALRAPLATLVVSVGLLLALAAPALGMKLKFPGMEDLPRSTPAMQAYDRLTAAFPSTGTSHSVAVRAPADQADRVRAALTGLAARAAGDRLFAPVEAEGPKIEVSADRRVAVLEVATPYASRTDEAVRSLHQLRDDLVPAALRGIPGVEYAVGGGVAASEDYARHIREKLPIVMG
ncbi:MAG TPA: MMPL family transporter, partial [Micromonospora sp.]